LLSYLRQRTKFTWLNVLRFFEDDLYIKEGCSRVLSDPGFSFVFLAKDFYVATKVVVVV
jgi:hypothetical protein